MKFEDIKVGGVYFYNWYEFIKFKSVNIKRSTNKRGIFIERDQADTTTFKERLVKNLEEYEDAKFQDRDFATNIIYFLFELPKK